MAHRITWADATVATRFACQVPYLVDDDLRVKEIVCHVRDADVVVYPLCCKRGGELQCIPICSTVGVKCTETELIHTVANGCITTSVRSNSNDIVIIILSSKVTTRHFVCLELVLDIHGLGEWIDFRLRACHLNIVLTVCRHCQHGVAFIDCQHFIQSTGPPSCSVRDGKVSGVASWCEGQEVERDGVDSSCNTSNRD